MERVRLILGVLMCVVAAGLMGCGDSGPELAEVDGTVTLDGQPLTEASVVFQPESGRPSMAITDSNGKYNLLYTADRTGALPGTHVVRITTQNSFEDEQGNTVYTEEKVPAKYNTESELTADVEAGKRNTHDFSLVSQ